jgi:hypothetical protein
MLCKETNMTAVHLSSAGSGSVPKISNSKVENHAPSLVIRFDAYVPNVKNINLACLDFFFLKLSDTRLNSF